MIWPQKVPATLGLQSAYMPGIRAYIRPEKSRGGKQQRDERGREDKRSKDPKVTSGQSMRHLVLGCLYGLIRHYFMGVL
jgi:hypothetical protein